MDLTDESLTTLIAGLRTGDPVALQDFFTRFGPTLERLADRNLAVGMRRRLGPEDVVQSVCRTFFRRAREGQFELRAGDELWRLLCAITVTKIREKVRFHSRQRRGLQCEVPLDAGGDGGPDRAPAAAGPGPLAEAEYADFMETALRGLSDEERQMLELRLQGHSREEIAEHLRCSVRTVTRLLSRVQAHFERLLQKG